MKQRVNGAAVTVALLLALAAIAGVYMYLMNRDPYDTPEMRARMAQYLGGRSGGGGAASATKPAPGASASPRAPAAAPAKRSAGK